MGFRYHYADVLPMKLSSRGHLRTTAGPEPLIGIALAPMVSGGAGCPNVSVPALTFRQPQDYLQCGQSHNAGGVAFENEATTLKIASRLSSYQRVHTEDNIYEAPDNCTHGTLRHELPWKHSGLVCSCFLFIWFIVYILLFATKCF